MSDKNENQDIVNDIINDMENQSNEIIRELESIPEEEGFVEGEEIIVENELLENDDTFKNLQRNINMPAQARPPRKKNSKSKKKKKKKRRRSRVPGILILVTLIFGVSIISSLVIIGYGKDMLGIGKSEETHVLIVRDGATTEEIAYMLENDNIIRSAKAFKMFADLRDKDISYISGEHFIRPNMAYETLINELTQLPSDENNVSVSVTFPEGVTLLEASYILEENNICDAEDFVFYFNSGGFGLDFENMLPSDTSFKFQKMEGYLFPDTYIFYENSDVETVCQKIYYNFDRKMKENDRLEKMQNLNLTLDRLITFASIVQKEAASSKEMENVASVFWNRLNNSDIFPLLQSDPTSNYSKDVIRPNIEYYNQTIIDAYDTYKSPGLPPGAICNPGLDAIDAVLAAKETDYFYFIANINTKITYYSSTLERHEEYREMIEQQYAEEARNNAEE